MPDDDRYKTAYGDRNQTPPDYTRCCHEVQRYLGNWPQWGQCTRKRGYGPDGAYCKQHDPEAVAKRSKEVSDREQARYRKQRLEWAGPRFYRILKQIADGHNDPRSLAQEAIAQYREDS